MGVSTAPHTKTNGHTSTAAPSRIHSSVTPAAAQHATIATATATLARALPRRRAPVGTGVAWRMAARPVVSSRASDSTVEKRSTRQTRIVITPNASTAKVPAVRRAGAPYGPVIDDATSQTIATRSAAKR